jgi:hypothetical protein
VGTDIDKEEFGERDHQRFAERLAECLTTLGQLLERPGFGGGPATIGAELELFLTDRAGQPLPRNQDIRAAMADPRVTVELNRFNLELNASPAPLAGRPFTALGGELNVLLDRVADAAKDHAGRPALIGILPTLRRADLGPGVITDVPRYRALGSGLRRLRQVPFRIQIAGEDPLELANEDVALEGANSSFQIHFRVDPAGFTRTYNAVQAATAPALAVAGNSPTFLGHRLWEETRIALFKQSVDDRQVAGAAAGRAQAAPGHRVALEPCHLRPRIGRASADRDAGPARRPHRHRHARQRRLPDRAVTVAGGAGPQWTYALPFERADHGFYRAAQHGLSAQLAWPAGHRDQIRTLAAAKLVAELVPAARQGLLQAGVAVAEADGLLGVISARAASGQTGAAWQRATLAAAQRRHDPERALAVMFDRYLECADTGLPVHTWPAASGPT